VSGGFFLFFRGGIPLHEAPVIFWRQSCPSLLMSTTSFNTFKTDQKKYLCHMITSAVILAATLARRPPALVIGAMKSGTSAVCDGLAVHPRILRAKKVHCWKLHLHD
jgi:hypothetical protein